ncbi:MAG: efflux RND transporter periplasmic adaptor subunit [Gemmatimonadaceae bacterium]
MTDHTSTRPSLDDRPESARKPHAGRIIFGSVVLIGGALATVAVLATHRSARAARVATTLAADAAAGPAVRTTIAEMSPPNPKVDFIGETKPYASVTLYAKVSGYLKSVSVDMGDRVKAGQIIATIESPETDRAYSGAKADYDNKQVTADRVAKLLDKKFAAPGEADQAKTEAAVARERLASLEDQRQYELLRAPFAGTITARFADPGALVQNAASSQTSALPVVTVSETDSLRILVYLDQGDATSVRPGTHATIRLAERPAFSMPATVARVSGQLDAKTRKMVAEFDVNDRAGQIVPGSFVQVEMVVPSLPRPQAPVEALIVRGGKSFVAVVDSSSHVRFREVTVAGNDGRIVTFTDGVSAGDRLALSLGSAIADGALVRVAETPAATPTAGTKP